jgi:hypothetical protein
MDMMNYDPNLVSCGRMARQSVKLTFGCNDYRAEMVLDVGGNCQGMSVIDTAVDSAYDKLLNDDDVGTITLIRENGDTLECSDDEDRQEDWLRGMVVGAEILSIMPADSARLPLLEFAT